MRRRPNNFRLNPRSPLARDLVFAGLGQHPQTVRYYDSCAGVIHAGNHGALVNSPAWIGPKLYFSASNKRVDLATALTFGIGEPWTFWALLTHHNWTVFDGWFGHEYTTATWGRFTTWNPSDTFVLVNDANTNVKWTSQTQSTSLLAIAIVHDGTNATLYVDGVSQGAKALANPITISRLNTFGGAGGDGHVSTWEACGIWSRALPAVEMSALADPPNVDLRVGSVPLILPVRRKAYFRVPAVVGVIPTRYYYQHLMGAA